MSDKGDIGTGGFVEAAQDKMSGGEGSSSGFPGLPDLPFDNVPDPALKAIKSGLRPSADGKDIEEIQDELGCGDGPAYMIRGVMRWVGVDAIPPVAEAVYGAFRTITGGN